MRNGVSSPSGIAAGSVRAVGTFRWRHLLTLVRSSLTLLAIVWVASYFLEHRTAIHEAAAGVEVRTLPLALGVLLVGLLPGAWAWQRLLGLALPGVSRRRGMLVYLRSGIGKYTPGGALALAIQHRLLRDDGARTVLLLQVFVGNALAACLAAAILGLPAALALIEPRADVHHALTAVALVASSLMLFCYRGRWPLLPGRLAGIGVPTPVAFTQTVVLMTGAWALSGLHLVVLGAGTNVGAPFLVSAYAFSAIAGIVFAALPGALGVRDGALLLILSTRLDPAEAATLALLSRTLVVAADVLGTAGAAWVLHRSNPSPPTVRTLP